MNKNYLEVEQRFSIAPSPPVYDGMTGESFTHEVFPADGTHEGHSVQAGDYGVGLEPSRALPVASQ